MKTLGRILIILLVTLMVIGVTYALSQTTAASTLASQAMGDRPTLPSNGQGIFTGEHSGGPGGEQSGMAWQTVLENLLKMSVIVAIVQVLWFIGRRITQISATSKRKNQPESA